MRKNIAAMTVVVAMAFGAVAAYGRNKTITIAWEVETMPERFQAYVDGTRVPWEGTPRCVQAEYGFTCSGKLSAPRDGEHTVAVRSAKGNDESTASSTTYGRRK